MLVSVNRVTESDREGKRLLRILGLVALGGVLGAVARALIEAAWPHSPDTIGWATLLINVSGCFLIGLLLGAIGRYRPEQELIRPFLGVGVLGGYTTFSTHIVEVLQLIEHGRPELGLAYLGLQLATGVIAVALGGWVFEWERRQ
jgi:CrcB protein